MRLKKEYVLLLVMSTVYVTAQDSAVPQPQSSDDTVVVQEQSWRSFFYQYGPPFYAILVCVVWGVLLEVRSRSISNDERVISLLTKFSGKIKKRPRMLRELLQMYHKIDTGTVDAQVEKDLKKDRKKYKERKRCEEGQRAKVTPRAKAHHAEVKTLLPVTEPYESGDDVDSRVLSMNIAEILELTDEAGGEEV